MVAVATISGGLSTLSQLYGFAGSAAQFAVQHIETLKGADNALANRCGEVLEAAHIGFGVGTETALLLIGAGQNMLGNPLTEALVVSGGANPIVMSCAAIGAIHYGWKAMSDSERDLLLSTVGAAFRVGIELVRSVVTFAYETIQRLIASSSEFLKKLKENVGEAASVFGRHLSDITRSMSDRLWEHALLVQSGVQAATSAALAYLPDRRGSSSAIKDDNG